MRLSRLYLESDRQSERSVEVHFDRDIAILDLAPAETTRTRLALETLFRGSSEFGRAYVTIDDTEIEVSPELAQHLSFHLGGRTPILDHASSTENETRSSPLMAVAMRAALEMLRLATLQLDRRSVDTALQAVRGDQRGLESDAKLRVMEAAGRQANAQIALSKIAHWRATIGPVHERSTDARRKARRRLSGPLAYHRYSKARDQEMEVLEAADFDSYEDFQASADAAEARYREELAQAQDEHDRAKQQLSALLDRTSAATEARVLAVQDYVLQLRLRQFTELDAVSPDDQGAVRHALYIMLQEGAGLASVTGDNLLRQAQAWLAQSESHSLKDDLGRSVLAHAQPIPALGTTPLILDGLLDGVEPHAAYQALTTLNPYVGSVQIVSLSYEPTIVRWAQRHTQPPTP